MYKNYSSFAIDSTDAYDDDLASAIAIDLRHTSVNYLPLSSFAVTTRYSSIRHHATMMATFVFGTIWNVGSDMAMVIWNQRHETPALTMAMLTIFVLSCRLRLILTTTIIWQRATMSLPSVRFFNGQKQVSCPNAEKWMLGSATMLTACLWHVLLMSCDDRW